MFNIYKNRYRLLIFPAILIILGVVFGIINQGFNLDTEFSGGTRLHIDMENEFNNEEVTKLIKDELGITAIVQKTGDGKEAIIKFSSEEDEAKEIETKLFDTLKTKYSLKGTEPLESGTLSPSFGKEMQNIAFKVCVIAVLLMLVYITLRFEWRSAIMAIVTLTINIAGMISIYLIFDLAVNTSFIAAILTILGYSVNDTIVIFDRIRENTGKRSSKKVSVIDTVEASIWQSMTRSLNTGTTTLMTVVLLYFIGVTSIQEFALPIMVGIIIGTYSSIFIAAPHWAAWKDRSLSKKKRIAKAN